jgi:hypothetical protein
VTPVYKRPLSHIPSLNVIRLRMMSDKTLIGRHPSKIGVDRRSTSLARRAIIDALQQDARQPFGTLADRVGTSRSRRPQARQASSKRRHRRHCGRGPCVFGLNSLAWIAVPPTPRASSRGGRSRELPPSTTRRDDRRVRMMAEAACTTVDALYELCSQRAPGARRAANGDLPYLKLLRQSFDWNRAAVVGDWRRPAVRARRCSPSTSRSFRPLSATPRILPRYRCVCVIERVVSARYCELNGPRCARPVSAVVNPLNVGWSTLAWLGIRYSGGGPEAVAFAGRGAAVSTSSSPRDAMTSWPRWCADADDLYDRFGSDRTASTRRFGGCFSYLRLLYRTPREHGAARGPWPGVAPR